MHRSVLLLLVILAGAGFYGGTLLVVDPTGEALGLRLDQLPGWYGGDYRWAGLLLVTGFGAAPLGAAVALWRDAVPAWHLVGVLGVGLLTWMAVQIAMVGLILPPMQLAFVGIGLALAGTSVAAGRRRRG